MIYGTVIGYAALLIARNMALWKRAVFVSAVVSVLLQTGYYLEGYPKEFVLEFMLLHFLMLLPSALIVLYAYDRIINKKNKRNLRKDGRKKK